MLGNDLQLRFQIIPRPRLKVFGLGRDAAELVEHSPALRRPHEEVVRDLAELEVRLQISRLRTEPRRDHA